MNVQVQLPQRQLPRAIKLNVDQFWHLKQAGAFAAYTKSELLDGEMSGVPRQSDDEPESDASVPIKLRVEDYLMLDEAGLLADLGKTELIDGLLYPMSPQHRAHWYAKNELTYRLRRALEEAGSTLYVGSEGSVQLSDVDLPEPDIIITSEPAGAGPIPLASIRLLVEIADSTQRIDMGEKAARYAHHAIPEYWVADLSARSIRQMSSPEGESYLVQREAPFGDPLHAATIEGLTVETTGLD